MVTGSDGEYVFPFLEPGTYDLTAKAANSLRQKVTDVVVTAGQETAGVNFDLLFGDADNDNYIDYKDRNILKESYGAALGSPEWDARADFDKDNIIDYKDRNILKNNYGLSGQP
jgi:ribosomal protein S18